MKLMVHGCIPVDIPDEPKVLLRNNIEEVLGEYMNGMSDYPDEYPQMSLEEAREYCTSQIYDMVHVDGFTGYQDGVAEHLKFLGNEYIYSIIDEIARDYDILA